MKSLKTKKIILIVMALLLIAWSVFLFSIDISVLVKIIGIENMYLILFIVAVLSSTSFLTSASFYAIFFVYANTGFDILTISIIGGIGMTVGDGLFFYISRTAGDVLSMSGNKVYKKIFNSVSKLPHIGVYIFTFIYAAFIPMPNDILIVMLGTLKFRYSRMIPIFVLGNIILLFLIASGIHWVL